METAIAVFSGLIALAAGLLQLTLIFEGLRVLGRIVFALLPKERLGWFALWGLWHLAVFAALIEFASEKISVDMEAFESVAFEAEGLRLLLTDVVLPLVISFVSSQATLHILNRCRAAA